MYNLWDKLTKGKKGVNNLLGSFRSSSLWFGMTSKSVDLTLISSYCFKHLNKWACTGLTCFYLQAGQFLTNSIREVTSVTH